MPVPSEETADVVGRLWDEVFTKGKLEVADKILASDYVLYDFGTTPGAEVRGPAGIKALVETFQEFYRDLEIHLDEPTVIQEGWVETHHTVSGTRRENGRPVSVGGISINLVSDGRIRKSWAMWDVSALLQQQEQGGAGGEGDIPDDLGDPEDKPEDPAIGRLVRHWW